MFFHMVWPGAVVYGARGAAAASAARGRRGGGCYTCYRSTAKIASSASRPCVSVRNSAHQEWRRAMPPKQKARVRTLERAHSLAIFKNPCVHILKTFRGTYCSHSDTHFLPVATSVLFISPPLCGSGSSRSFQKIELVMQSPAGTKGD